MRMSVEKITQAELRTLIAIDLQVRRLRRSKLELETDILQRLIAGAGVEPGPHSVRIYRRNVRRGYVDSLVYG